MPPAASDAAPLLRTFLEGDEAASDGVLDLLVRVEAVPVIRAIVASRTGRDDLEDVCNDVVLQITRRLRDARAGGETEPINSFRAYVATAAYRACDTRLREKYPERSRLQNRIRYVVSHHPALFSAGSRCGLAGTQGHPPGSLRSFEQVAEAELHGQRLVATLTRLLRAASGPLEIDNVVSLLAPVFNTAPPADAPEEIADVRAGIGVTLVHRSHLQQLWKEVRLLPPAQRVALLFNLRDDDGEDLLSVLSIIGIATVAEIAAVAEMPLDRFLTISGEFPWGDARIAELLGVTRQQVINLRKSARARLSRRLRR
jgi:DNA-directed RNA polymerase specialized sigma24 family protein